jgi:polysaccharide pyruvyl transferase WcaK-like protein
MHSQTTLIGGGTCLPSISMCMRPTKYAYVFGAGVLDPVFHGPFDPELIDRFKLLNFRLISVRGNISKGLLRDWGIDSEVIGDPCLSLKPTEVLEKCNNRIAINVGAAFSKFSWESGDRVLRELSKVCEVLKNKGYEIVLIPFWKNNMQDVENLSKKVGVGIFEKWQDIEATLNLISNCKIFIGEKLHSLVFSAAANTPFIGLAYAPEHFDFVDSVGFSEFTMPTTEITAEKIMALFNGLLNNYETIQDKLAGRVNEYREKQRKFASRISCDLESLPEDKWAIQNNCGNTLVLRADLLLYTKMSKIWNVWDRLVFSRLMPYLI